MLESSGVELASWEEQPKSVVVAIKNTQTRENHQFFLIFIIIIAKKSKKSLTIPLGELPENERAPPPDFPIPTGKEDRRRGLKGYHDAV